MSAYNVAKECDLRCAKCALFEFGKQLIGLHDRQDSVKVLQMLINVFAVYEYVVHVHDNKLAKEWLEDVVHGSLKSCGCVGQAKGQHHELIQPKRRAESSFGYIRFGNADLVVATLQIQRGENCSTVEVIKKIINAWQWVFVLDSDFVEGTVVNAHAHSAILFLDKQYRCTIR